VIALVGISRQATDRLRGFVRSAWPTRLASPPARVVTKRTFSKSLRKPSGRSTIGERDFRRGLLLSAPGRRRREFRRTAVLGFGIEDRGARDAWAAATNEGAPSSATGTGRDFQPLALEEAQALVPSRARTSPGRRGLIPAAASILASRGRTIMSGFISSRDTPQLSGRSRNRRVWRIAQSRELIKEGIL
jgi:hypothetical protein